ncbi:MAG: hypothetical protein JW982_10205 [Spirochaetes bacterium]|nr:hypothetical protein [Spirochaetota bacterium]
MSKIQLIISSVIIFLSFIIYAQTPDLPDTDVLKNNDDFRNPIAVNSDNADNSQNAENVNIDVQVVYGQYNNMNSVVSISQESENFVYLLNSDFKRSNDYGYNQNLFDNSSYYKNKIEFTGNINFSETLKSINEIYIDNDSKGMFDNPNYSHEDKDKFYIKSTNVKKFSPKVEGFSTIAYSSYKHRLVGGELQNSDSSDLNNVFFANGGEIIWSSSNRLKLNTEISRYFYSENEDDFHVSGQLVDDFKISSYVGISIGANVQYDQDMKLLGYNNENYPYFIPVIPGVFAISIKGLKYTSLSIQYSGEYEFFKPEVFYFQQDFILPSYDLPSSRVHNLSLKCDFKYTDRVAFKFSGYLKGYDNYLTYKPQVENNERGNVLSSFYFPAIISVVESSGEFSLIPDVLFFTAGYKYFHSYETEYNIIYTPEHTSDGSIRLDTDYGSIEWKNSYLSDVYIDPESDEKMKFSIVGDLNVLIKTADTLFINVKLENLYNTEYFIREGYPESGFTALLGLKIIL